MLREVDLLERLCLRLSISLRVKEIEEVFVWVGCFSADTVRIRCSAQLLDFLLQIGYRCRALAVHFSGIV